MVPRSSKRPLLYLCRRWSGLRDFARWVHGELAAFWLWCNTGPGCSVSFGSCLRNSALIFFFFFFFSFLITYLRCYTFDTLSCLSACDFPLHRKRALFFTLWFLDLLAYMWSLMEHPTDLARRQLGGLMIDIQWCCSRAICRYEHIWRSLFLSSGMRPRDGLSNYTLHCSKQTQLPVYPSSAV